MTDVATKPDADVEPELDRVLLEEARQQTGAKWPNDVLNEGLRLLVGQARERRRQAYDRVQRMVAEEGLDFAAIDEVDR